MNKEQTIQSQPAPRPQPAPVKQNPNAQIFRGIAVITKSA